MKCVKSEKFHLKFKLKIKRKKRQQTDIPHFSICKAQKQKNKIEKKKKIITRGGKSIVANEMFN